MDLRREKFYALSHEVHPIYMYASLCPSWSVRCSRRPCLDLLHCIFIFLLSPHRFEARVCRHSCVRAHPPLTSISTVHGALNVPSNLSTPPKCWGDIAQYRLKRLRAIVDAKLIGDCE